MDKTITSFTKFDKQELYEDYLRYTLLDSNSFLSLISAVSSLRKWEFSGLPPIYKNPIIYLSNYRNQITDNNNNNTNTSTTPITTPITPNNEIISKKKKKSIGKLLLLKPISEKVPLPDSAADLDLKLENEIIKNYSHLFKNKILILTENELFFIDSNSFILKESIIITEFTNIINNKPSTIYINNNNNNLLKIKFNSKCSIQDSITFFNDLSILIYSKKFINLNFNNIPNQDLKNFKEIYKKSSIDLSSFKFFLNQAFNILVEFITTNNFNQVQELISIFKIIEIQDLISNLVNLQGKNFIEISIKSNCSKNLIIFLIENYYSTIGIKLVKVIFNYYKTKGVENYKEIVNVLGEKGVKFNEIDDDDDDGNSILHYLIKNNYSISLIAELIKYQLVDVNLFNSKFKTPLHIAIEMNNYSMVVILLIGGSDILLKNGNFRNSLQYSFENQDQSNPILQLLVKIVKFQRNLANNFILNFNNLYTLFEIIKHHYYSSSIDYDDYFFKCLINFQPQYLEKIIILNNNKSNSNEVFTNKFNIDISQDSLKFIGSGGFGDVYKTYCSNIGTEVALKRFKNTTDKEGLENFNKEFNLVTKSQFPTTVCVYGSFIDTDGIYYMVMEYCENGSLDSYLKKLGPINWNLFFKIAMSILHCVNDLHNCSPIILHRDFKLSNFLVDKNGDIKIADFGLGKLNVDTTSTISSLQRVRGTKGYIAPELYYGIQYDTLSDMFSIAIVLSQLLNHLIYNTIITPLAFDTNNTDRPILPPNSPNSIYNFIMKMWCNDRSIRQSSSQAIKELISIEKEYQNNKDEWDQLYKHGFFHRDHKKRTIQKQKQTEQILKYNIK